MCQKVKMAPVSKVKFTQALRGDDNVRYRNKGGSEQ